MALWTFNDQQEVLHAYVPVDDATRLDAQNYVGSGTAHLFHTWCDALAANVAYAQQLKNAGTPCRCVVVVITDGEDVGSVCSANNCRKLSEDLLKSEQFVLAFVEVGDEASFRMVAKSMGVPDGSILVQKDATPSGIRNVFQMVSRSAIRASQGRIAPGPQRASSADAEPAQGPSHGCRTARWGRRDLGRPHRARGRRCIVGRHGWC